MKKAPVSAILRSLLLVGIAVPSACSVANAPGRATEAHLRPSAEAKPIARRRPPVLLSDEGRARAERAGLARPKPVTDGHDVFGSKDLLSYYGGPVISNVHVVMVHWGDVSDSTNTVNAALAADLPGFFEAITTGPYFSWLAEYNTTPPLTGTNQTIGFGTVDTSGPDTGGAYLITPTINTTKTLNDGWGTGDIANELSYQIASGFLPAPELDSSGYSNSVYVVDFPPGFEINGAGGSYCADFCAYHEAFGYGTDFLLVPYTVNPDSSTCAGCGFKSTYLDAEQFLHSHELVEAVTDNPQLLGWVEISGSGGGEIGDLCETLSGATVSGYYATTLWSNANGGCIIEAPLCDTGSPAPPSCTPCNTTGAPSCTSPNPVCDTTSGLCRGCLLDTDCANPTPICDAASLTCRACKPADCKGATPVCGTSGFDVGFCVQCDVTDSSACKGATPVCAAYPDFKCVGCLFNSDCTGTTPVCDTTSDTCRACTSNADCSPGVCDPGSGACVGCLSSSDCGSETCNPSTHTCQCTGSSECKNPTPVCSSGKTCAPCSSSGDCAGNPSGGACSAGSCVECATSADCSAPTPVCDKKANKCVAGADAGSGADSAGPPPADSGVKRPDSGSGDGGTGAGIIGGCSAAPSGAEHGAAGLPWIAIAGLAVIGARRRRRAGERACARVRFGLENGR